MSEQHTTPDETSGSPAKAPTAQYKPVNVALPDWQCPHCQTRYQSRFERASECANAGPAPTIETGQPMLVVNGTYGGRSPADVRLGLVQAGPVRPVRVDDAIVAHARDVTVAGRAVPQDCLANVTHGHDGLVLAVTPQRPPQISGSDGIWSYSCISRLMLAKESFGDRYDDDVPVWVEQSYARSDWVRAPDGDQRAALNVVTAGLLDRIVDIDEGELTALIRDVYRPSRSYSRAQSIQRLVAPQGGLLVAEAHGSPTHLWSVRWLAQVIDTVAAWQAQTLRQWAAGTGDPIALGGMRAPDNLPKNPGKRRLAAMEPYAQSYDRVISVVLNQLTVEAPANPVRGVPSVAEVIGPNTKESTPS